MAHHEETGGRGTVQLVIHIALQHVHAYAHRRLLAYLHAPHIYR